MKEILKTYGPWLLAGVMMFVMMRYGGCCGGHRHSGRERDKEHSGPDHADGQGKDAASKERCH